MAVPRASITALRPAGRLGRVGFYSSAGYLDDFSARGGAIVGVAGLIMPLHRRRPSSTVESPARVRHVTMRQRTMAVDSVFLRRERFVIPTSAPLPPPPPLPPSLPGVLRVGQVGRPKFRRLKEIGSQIWPQIVHNRSSTLVYLPIAWP